jgi:hypothetical protein
MKSADPQPPGVARRAKAVIVLVVGLVTAALALAQYQVNTQVNNRMNPELYGGGTGGSMRYAMPQTTVLPSEARYATWRSGALPSEIRMNYLQSGPLTPNGAISYIPQQSSVQQAMRLPAPQLYNPAYGIQNQGVAAAGPGQQQKPVSTGPINGQLPNGSIRHAGVEPAAPSAFLPAQPSWTQPLNQGPLPPVTPPTPEPTRITRPPPTTPTPSTNTQAPATPYYLSRLSTPTGSIRYSGDASGGSP